MSSAARIRAVVTRRPVDHIPLCFEGLGHPWVAFLVKRFPDPLERAEQMLALGLDTGYTVRRWSENRTVAGRWGRGKGLLRLLSRPACVLICLVSDMAARPVRGGWLFSLLDMHRTLP